MTWRMKLQFTEECKTKETESEKPKAEKGT